MQVFLSNNLEAEESQDEQFMLVTLQVRQLSEQAKL
jgi:hypothetical protein